MIKVLHVINWLRRGGVETQLLEILRNYDRKRFQIDVCCFGSEKGYLADQAIEYGSKVLECPKSANLFSFSKRFRNLLIQNQYDIVHCHSEAWSGPVLRGAKQFGVPVRIAHIRSCRPQGFKIKNIFLKTARDLLVGWGRRWLIENATHILGVSESVLDARFPSWQAKDIFCVWTLGVDPDKFYFGKKQYRPSAAPIIINVGSFIPQRRQDILIHIHSRVIQKFPDAKLLLVGKGERMAHCRELTRRLHMEKAVEFAGLCDNIPDMLQKADVFVTASEVEGMPNALLEAQSAGLPIIASNIPSHREALDSLSYPFLFTGNDTEKASQAICRIVNDSSLYARLSIAGRKRIETQYDSRDTITHLQNMYDAWSNRP